jgi:hypothetical protein
MGWNAEMSTRETAISRGPVRLDRTPHPGRTTTVQARIKDASLCGREG